MEKSNNIHTYIKLFEEAVQVPDKLINYGVIKKLNDLNYFTAPLNITGSGAYTGGLFDYSVAVAKLLFSLSGKNNLQASRITCYIIGMFHSLYKCRLYKLDKRNTSAIVQGRTLDINGAEPVWVRSTEDFKNNSVDMIEDIIGKSFLISTERECIAWYDGACDDNDSRLAFLNKVREDDLVLWTHFATTYVEERVMERFN